jgi:hypothetical protein
MTGIRHKDGRKRLATRPEVPACEFSDEISNEAFAKLRTVVADLNDPSHKRVIVNGIDWPED